MAKSAQQSAAKYVSRAGAATQDYVDGAANTTKDQAQAAIAAKTVYQQALTESFGRDAFAKGLQKSGKSGWQTGVAKKGSLRFAEGVQSGADSYATESGRYDSARNAAASLPRGLKGSETNFARSKAVGAALRAAKVGASK